MADSWKHELMNLLCKNKIKIIQNGMLHASLDVSVRVGKSSIYYCENTIKL